MKFCRHCGSNPTKLKDNPEDHGWTAFYRCGGCGISYRIIYPDQMSGNHKEDITEYDKGHQFKHEHFKELE